MKQMKNYKILSLMFLLVSCSSEPVPIQYGKDNCEHCKMTIMDNKFGTELITDKGKVYKFDSDECLRDYFNSKQPKISQILVTDYSIPGKLVDAKSAWFLHSDKMKSPMGGNLAAFATKEKAASYLKKYPGELWTWDELLTH